MTRRSLTINVQDVSGRPDTPPKEHIRHWVAAAVGGDTNGEITVRIVTELESANLNTQYRDRPGATNVLAFPAADDLPELVDDLPPIGDLVICAAVVVAEGGEPQASEAHWAHVVVHGTLHLLGYDHENDADASIMETRERELLAAMGFADPYAALE